MALFLSPTRIRDFEQCPYRYQLSTNKAVRELWSKPKSYFTFSNTLHAVLRDLYRKGGPAGVDWNWVQARYRLQWRGLNPIASGFASRDQAKESYLEGLALLQRYYESNREEPHRAEMVEQGLEYQSEDAQLWGRLDRVDRLPDGGIEIIDYKTGRYRLDEEAVGRDWQMNLYGLLVHDALKPGQITLSLYYLRENVKVSVPMLRDPEEVRQDFSDIALIIGTTDDFTPSPNRFCRFCDYASACPVGPQMERPSQELLRRLEQSLGQLADNRYLQQKLEMAQRHLALAGETGSSTQPASAPPPEAPASLELPDSAQPGELQEGLVLLEAALLPLLPDRGQGTARALAELGQFHEALQAWAAAEAHFAAASPVAATSLLARYALEYGRALEAYVRGKMTYLAGSRELAIRGRRTTLAGLGELGLLDLGLCSDLLSAHPPLFFKEPNGSGQLVDDLIRFRHQCHAIVAHARTTVPRSELVEVRDQALRLLVRLTEGLRRETSWSSGAGPANAPA
ncbi:MAG: PD-(D/E)XK nuclease family protein [Firmicutes bacterium]|nr:PD-(D/E)XK nuclease family protein [Bacillota bacterium]